MLISAIYNLIMDFIQYIYSDGFFSLKSLTFTMFVLYMCYEVCKDWIYNIGIESDYFKKEDIENFKMKDPIKKKLELKTENNKQETQDQLQLYTMFYTMFNNKK